MHQKKKVSATILAISIALIIVNTGCSRKSSEQKNNPIEPAESNSISFGNDLNYKNKDLKFSLNLPEDFKYYQTQRKNQAAYTDLEFLVPTSDERYRNYEVPSYFKPIIVRVSPKELDQSNLNGYQKIDKSGPNYYYIYFENINKPKDWESKLNQDFWDKIYKSFNLYL